MKKIRMFKIQCLLEKIKIFGNERYNDNSYNLYWIRKGSQSVYSEVEEENVGKDEIELSGYIGENISQIDQNIKFTIENEVDAGKFKQNDNVCFACHKDDSIREIDITGDGGYMLYGIKYNMDGDSVRTILSKSDIWTIQKIKQRLYL